MSASPYVPFYTSDFLAGTSGMTAATKGVYITLISLIYEAEKPLAQSWDTLARRCGCTLPAFKKAVASLEDDGKVTLTDDGIWSDKCEKHIAQRRDRQGSAKAAAETRWEKTKQKQGKANATASVPQCQPEPEPKRDTKVSLQEFEKFWSEVPKKVGKGGARKSFAKAVKTATADEIINGMKRHAVAMRGKDPQFIPNPTTWLNQERWTDEVQADTRKWYEKPESEWTKADRDAERMRHL